MSMYTIPDILAIKNSQGSNKTASDQWKEYFLKQEIIRTITNKKALAKILDYVIDVEDIAFVVFFPKSVIHFHDFMGKIESATAKAEFYKAGIVSITGVSESVTNVTYAEAWQVIALRTTGSDVLKSIPVAPTEAISADIEAIKTLHDKMPAILQKWCDAFDTIPGIRIYAEISNGEVEDQLIKGSFDMNPEIADIEGYASYELQPNGVVDIYNEYGKQSKVYTDWREKYDASENKTWQFFYESLIELSKLYGSVPELQEV